MMDRQIRRLALSFLALIVVLFAQTNFLQVFASSRYANNPANQRLLLQEYAVDRGDILARDAPNLRTLLCRPASSHATSDFNRRLSTTDWRTYRWWPGSAPSRGCTS